MKHRDKKDRKKPEEIEDIIKWSAHMSLHFKPQKQKKALEITETYFKRNYKFPKWQCN